MSAMHADSRSDIPPAVPWYRELTRAHWFVLVVASLGWLFDTMDQQLFNLARRPAIAELARPPRRRSGDARAHDRRVCRLRHHDLHDRLGDRRRRSSASWATGSAARKTMMLTILLYSVFTGLSVFSTASGTSLPTAS